MRRSRRSASGLASPGCSSRAAATSPARARLDRISHDRDETVVVGARLAEQGDLVLSDVLQAVEVVAELAELTQHGIERALVLGQQRGEVTP